MEDWKWKARTIDQDPWIAIVGSEVPVLTKNAFKGKRVEAILDERGKWKENEVVESFSTIDAEAEGNESPRTAEEGDTWIERTQSL